MSYRPNAASLQVAAMVISSAVAVILLSGGSRSAALESIAFFMGAGGMIVTFYQWRRQGDRCAAALTIAAFGTWALAVAVASATGFDSGTLAFWIAGAALLIGFGGGVVTLLRMYRERGRDSEAPPAEQR